MPVFPRRRCEVTIVEKKIIIVCEGKSDFAYLNALQRFIDNDIPLPPGQDDPLLRFVPFPEPLGTCTGAYDKIIEAYRDAVEEFYPDPVEIWVDADIYIRNESLKSDPTRHNGTEYANRQSDIPIFNFSYHNFEDFIALHCDKDTFQRWKTNVLQARQSRGNKFCLPHHDYPLSRNEYSPLFQKVLPHYSKRKTPFELSISRLANLRHNLKDPDVQSMLLHLQPGIAFGSHLLELFDDAYPGLIP